MAKTTFKIEGLRELKSALEGLPKATSTTVLKRTLMEAGYPMELEAVAYAPHLTGALKRSFKIGTRISKNQRRLNKKESQVEVYIGPGQNPQAIMQEFGTKTNSPQPFLRPAWDSGKMAALNKVRTILANEIEKASARLARKTAKYMK